MLWSDVRHSGRSHVLSLLATLLILASAVGAAVGSGVKSVLETDASGADPLPEALAGEADRVLFGIIESDPNPGGVSPLPGPLQSPPGYVAPARFNASQFTAPPPVASVQCNPPCLNGGFGKLSSSGVCTCTCLKSDNTPGSKFYTGLQCQTPAITCNQYGFYCSNNGTCPLKGTGTCQCPAPYYGTQCELAGAVCGAVNCQNGATCGPDANNQPVCVCVAGYTGPDCSEFNPQTLAAAAQAATSTQPSTSMIGAPHSSAAGAKWYYILIGIVGGVAFCCLVGASLFFVWRKRVPTTVPSSMKKDSLARQDGSFQMQDLGPKQSSMAGQLQP